MKRLIVNADDFGMTPGVSRGILSAHRRGIVTSTTVLATAAIDPRLVDEARDSGLGLGLHINLTLGAPLTRAPSLVDAAGRFVRDARRVAARARERDVAAEVEAQVERFQEVFRRSPTHVDTHHHVGLYTPVREVVLTAARGLRVPVRSQDERMRAAARAAGLRTSDHFFGESGPEAYWSLARTLEHLRRLPIGISEFMTHPGIFDESLAGSRYGRQRETEMIGVGSPAARAAALALGVSLCHFGQI